MNRRGFLTRLVMTLAGVTLAPLAKCLPAPEGFTFPAGTFLFTSDPPTRFTRLDVFYGFGWLRPDITCRIVADDQDLDVIDIIPIRSVLADLSIPDDAPRLFREPAPLLALRVTRPR